MDSAQPGLLFGTLRWPGSNQITAASHIIGFSEKNIKGNGEKFSFSVGGHGSWASHNHAKRRIYALTNAFSFANFSQENGSFWHGWIALLV